MKKLFFLAIVLLSSPASAEPTYEEIVRFIHGKTSINFSTDTKMFVEFPQRCVLVQNSVEPRTGPATHVSTRTVNLKDIDPDRISNWENRMVTLGTRENKKLVRSVTSYHAGHSYFQEARKGSFYTCTASTCTDEVMTTDVGVHTFDGADNVPRLVRAFTALVKECGGKKELF